MKNENTVKIIPLGGMREVGKNLTIIEYREDIIIVDCGMTFPEDEMLGIDVVIPDITYLKKKRKNIRGLVITHGHEDHIGAIPYLLKKIDVPVYGTKLTLGLLENKLREHRLSDTKLHVVEYGDIVKLGKMEVEWIRINHSIPDSSALAIKTPIGNIVVTGDFKVDFTPISGKPIDLNRFAELGSKGVLALISDSTNVLRPGYTMSESKVGDTFNRIFGQAKSRIIIATFASNVHRIQQIINAAQLYNRKVVLSGRSMLNVTATAEKLGHLHYDKDTLIDIKDMDKYDPDELVIITTGSQGEPMAALTRIAYGEHKKIHLNSDDMVILSATPIPGNENDVSKVINNLMETGATVIYEALSEIHVSGHACQEELKLILSLTQPKYFIPAHGEIRHLMKHAEIAKKMGVKEEDIFLMENGNCLEISSENAKFTADVPAGNILVDGLGIGDVGNIVLRDRKHLSEDGLIVVVITMSRKEQKISSGPDIISRGFVYVRESENLMEEARDTVKTTLDTCVDKNIFDWSTLKAEIREDLKSFIFKKTKRNPMILPIIMEV